ncbi:MAG TPA: hypothetical protein VMG98_01770 [Verrucomicrobiae bacterium]|nr:hypothetical protein [Verrucomicrobiae bacterium]
MRYAFALAIVIVALLAACNGSGGSSLPAAGASPAASQRSSGSATFAIFIPTSNAMKKARPDYVSPNTQFAGITLTEESGSPVPSPTPLVVNLAPGSPNCSTTLNGTTCTVTATYLVGADAWTIALYGSGGVTSTPLSINSVAQNLVAGQNTVDLTMNPVVASLTFSPSSGSCASNNTTCVQYGALEALDATSAVIVGPGNYVNASQAPVTVNVAPPPSGVSLDTSSGSAAATSAAGPAQMNLAQIAYDGSGSAGTLQVTASDTNGDNASYTLDLTTPKPTPTASATPVSSPQSVPGWNGKTLYTNYSTPPSVNGTDGEFDPPYHDTPSGGQGPLGSTFDNQTCAATMSNNYHIHVFIGIYVDGTELALPRGLGIYGGGNPPPDEIVYASCFYSTHTHDSTGVFHVEDPNPNNVPITQPIYATGDLFTIWGITVNSTQFGQFAGPVTVYTSGQVFRGGGDCSGNIPPSGTVLGGPIIPESDLSLWTGDPNAIPLYSHEVIWYLVGPNDPTSLPQINFDEEC